MKKKIIYSLLTFGLTALIGVGAFVGLQNKPIKETRAIEAPKKQAKITEISDFEESHTYYIVAKNYATNGEGEFYQNTPTPDNTAMYPNNYPYVSRCYADFTMVKNDHFANYRMNFSASLNGGVYKPSLISLNAEDGTTNYVFDWSYGLYRTNCAFVCKDFTYIGESFLDRLFWLFDVYDLTIYAESYDFEKAFNFNNFYQVQSTFYAQPYSPVVGVTTGNDDWEKTYDLGLFYSGGLVFDQIKVTFAYDINGYYFETGPNTKEYKQFPTEGLNAKARYFLKMEYINTATNFTILACNRTSFQDGSKNCIDFLPAWSNQGFKQLQFQTQINSLFNRSVFNSLSDTEQLNTPTAHPDVGMGNAFSLIGQAFTAWLPILSVSVIPGISLGTLIFLPLIAGIIILIIWIVKR